MPDLLTTSISGLLTSQRALSVTGHNIANANTPGYARQRLQLAARLPDGFGALAIGRGVQATGVERVFDQFLGNELRVADSSFSRLDAFYGLAARADALLADPVAGISPAISGFFAAVQDVANDPASIPAREALLGRAESLADRFAVVDRQLGQLGSEVGSRIDQSVARINSLAEGIAAINADIVTASGASGGNPPGDLLDQRDAMLGELATLVDVTTVPQDDGALNVFIGSGQGLVVGSQTASLGTDRNQFDPTALEVVFVNGTSRTPVTSSISGGSLGGALDFRREVLDPARSELGRIATAVAGSVNAQLGQGMDLYGDLGSPLFEVADPQVLYAGGNAGSAVVSASVTDVGALTADNYVLRYDGAAYSLTRQATGEVVPMTGTGAPGDPFVAEGLSLVVGAAAAAGDGFLIRPTQGAASSMQVGLSDPRRIAAAGPVRTAADSGNTGTGAITQGTVTDATNPALLAPATITFTAPGTYEVDGAGPFAYTEGDPINVNGVDYVITGAPEAGDTFTIEANVGGEGDNRNAMALAGLGSAGILDGGTIGITSAFGGLVAQVGTVTGQAGTGLAAQGVLRDQAQQQVLSVSGVNLDEEAANMLRFQQAYEAAAQMISVADTLFQTLLASVR